MTRPTRPTRPIDAYASRQIAYVRFDHAGVGCPGVTPPRSAPDAPLDQTWPQNAFEERL